MISKHTDIRLRLRPSCLARTLLDNVQSCLTRPSVSVGVGLLYRLPPVRVELNFGVPLVASKSDGHRKGFQIGIGIDFL